MKSQLDTFDGLDNRRDLMIMLKRLGSNLARARFIRSLLPASGLAFAGMELQVDNPRDCDPVTAYFMLISVCNELGVPIDVAAHRLEANIRGVVPQGG